MCFDVLTETERFDVENNLFVNNIPNALIACPKLEVINLSSNYIDGYIPWQIGLRKHMREIELHHNKLSGSLPLDIFHLENIEVLNIRSNSLTGLIPTDIGNLQNATFISLSHNSLKGRIPPQFESLSKLEYLHLHNNLLTGKAPNMPWLREIGNMLGDTNRYITDCGDPSFLLENPISCPSCTLCCNSDALCQENIIWLLSTEKGAFIIIFGFPVLLAIVFYVSYLGVKLLCTQTQISGKRQTIYLVDEDSTYCLVFAKSYLGWIIYLVVFILQGCIYYMFLLASSFTSDSSDWQFTYQCPPTSESCINDRDVSQFGWALFFVVTLSTLSVDYINSSLQIRKSVRARSWRMFFSGFLYLGMTVMALLGSVFYNMALTTTNTELILNAVILLFINDLDEQLMNAMQALAPDWVDKRIEEVRETLSSPPFEFEQRRHASMEDNSKDLNNERNFPVSSFSEAELSNEYRSRNEMFMDHPVIPSVPAIEAVYMRSARKSSYRKQHNNIKRGW